MWDQAVASEQAQMVRNGQKWPKIEFSGLSQENGVVIVWSSSLSVSIITTASSDKTFVNISIDVVKGSLTSRNEQ